jgi:hypothetical protein
MSSPSARRSLSSLASHRPARKPRPTVRRRRRLLLEPLEDRRLLVGQLTALGKAVLDFESPQDLDDWLNTQATSDNGSETADPNS